MQMQMLGVNGLLGSIHIERLRYRCQISFDVYRSLMNINSVIGINATHLGDVAIANAISQREE